MYYACSLFKMETILENRIIHSDDTTWDMVVQYYLKWTGEYGRWKQAILLKELCTLLERLYRSIDLIFFLEYIWCFF